MGELKINKRQEVKLLEMCKYFFPETKNWMDNYVVIYKQTYENCVEEYILKGVDFNEYEESDTELHYITLSNESRIPWFEFCVIHLSKKILNHSEMCDKTSDLKYYVDYLYKKFKRNIKINKK